MITEGTQLWRTLFSGLCRSINRQSSAKFLQSAQKCYSRYQFLCQSLGNLAVSCSSLLSSRSKISDKSLFLKIPIAVSTSFSFPMTHFPWSIFLRLGMATWSLDLRPQSHFTSQNVVLDRTATVFLPCQHKVVLPAFNWSICLARDQWPYQSRPTRRRHCHWLCSWYCWLPDNDIVIVDFGKSVVLDFYSFLYLVSSLEVAQELKSIHHSNY